MQQSVRNLLHIVR